ncbi:MAG: F0F1 ATP synthase subunit A [wastewater metagenome]|nr:F0F1 ATP synthase subunit A [Candidatus Loosdrechtia aerotolerans]
MEINPDSIVFWKWVYFKINATLFYSWIVMLILILVACLATWNLTAGYRISRWQNILETIVSYMRTQIRETTQEKPDPFLPFLGTLFLFISVSNFLSFVPVYHPPTGSVSTTAALAICVFFAVPVYGIRQLGFTRYFQHYIKSTVFLLPFNIIGRFSRTLALAIRLFGNIMSGTMIGAVLVSIVPLFVPIVMHALGLLIGQIQAYIFAVLAAVYIGSAIRAVQ